MCAHSTCFRRENSRMNWNSYGKFKCKRWSITIDRVCSSVSVINYSIKTLFLSVTRRVRGQTRIRWETERRSSIVYVFNRCFQVDRRSSLNSSCVLFVCLCQHHVRSPLSLDRMLNDIYLLSSSRFSPNCRLTWYLLSQLTVDVSARVNQWFVRIRSMSILGKHMWTLVFSFFFFFPLKDEV
jgi:hypothetical protein